MATKKHQPPTTNHPPQNIDGVLLVNKPKGLTSFQVVSCLRKHFGVKKVGHGGTLDPFATGLLVILFGGATKVSNSFLSGDKAYEGVMIFGKETDTYDVTGRVVKKSRTLNVNENIISKVFKAFEGEIEQVPPSFSAVKVKGKKAYELARKGQRVELKSRKVRVYYLKLVKLEREKFIKAWFSTKVSKGTYIRSLANDIGQRLGVGAYLEELKRTSSGKFLLKDSFSLEEVLQWDREQLTSKIIVRALRPMAILK